MKPGPTPPSMAERLEALYPHMSAEAVEEAELNLRAYAEAAIAVYQRLEADPEAMKRFRSLLSAHKYGTTEGKVDHCSE